MLYALCGVNAQCPQQDKCHITFFITSRFAMPNPIIQNKIYIPPPGQKAIIRSTLIERLNEGRHGKLTLICAPAGYGKSTLISEWLTATRTAASMVSLDSGDNDFVRFMTYMLAAVRSIFPEKGERLMEIAQNQAPQAEPMETFMATLIHELNEIEKPYVLALDDYHVIENPKINEAVSFLIEHLPFSMQLAISTREEPDLPLAKFRARGQLTELRPNDLCFNKTETSRFFLKTMGLHLSENDIEALVNRTEGWIAGLNLAGISMLAADNPHEFVLSFAGSHHFVMDYLMEEVFQTQPETVQNFLLSTSILTSMCGPLCDAVMESNAGQGQELLEKLNQANMFLVPLDNERKWYRYHHLFHDLLRQRLRKKTEPESPQTPNPLEHAPEITGKKTNRKFDLPNLHLRAGKWYEKNNRFAEAFIHSLEAGDTDRAATMAQIGYAEMEAAFQLPAWLELVKKLPKENLYHHPFLCYQYAAALTDVGELEASEEWLNHAQERIDSEKSPSPNPESWTALRGNIARQRSHNAQSRGDIPSTIKYIKQALQLMPGDDYLGHGAMEGSLGLIHWVDGNLPAAKESFQKTVRYWQKAENLNFEIATGYALADLETACGKLTGARDICHKLLLLADEKKVKDLHGAGLVHFRLGMIYHEMGETEKSDIHLRISKDIANRCSSIYWPWIWNRGQAIIMESAGEMENALERLEEAKRKGIRSSEPNLRPMEAMKAKIFVKMGRLKKAMEWVEENHIPDLEISYRHEFELLTLVRITREQITKTPDGANLGGNMSINRAFHLLDKLLERAKKEKRYGSVIEILVQKSLTCSAAGDFPAAFDALTQALEIGEPERFARVFIDEGLRMMELLARLNDLLKENPAEGVAPEVKKYTGHLLSFFQKQPRQEIPAVKSSPKKSIRNVETPAPALVEPLSDREVEVLHLVASGLSNKEIGDRLSLELNTIKGHNRNIFSKLGVRRRTEAVARARQLGLLSGL